MDEEKLVVEEKMGPVKDLHARFEKTPMRKPLGEIPTVSSRLGKEESSINMKSTLQKWESKTFTPFLTPQKQKMIQPEHVTRSEPRGGRFTRGRNFNFDGDGENDDDESGGPIRRTSMPAVGAVKNALKQYLANTGQSEKEVKNVASPYPAQQATKSRRALVPKMGSIEEDGEDNDENQPLSIRVPANKTQTSSTETDSTGSFEVGLKGFRSTTVKSKLGADVKPMDEWKSPVKSISKANTPCKQKGYIFDEFAVGLKALKCPKKTEVEGKSLTVSGSVEIDEPPVVSSFEVGLKALRTPKRGTTHPDTSETKPEETEQPVSNFAVGLKALRAPKKDVVNEALSRDTDAPKGEVKSFEVGSKALKKPDSKAAKIEQKLLERNFGVGLKAARTSKKPQATDNKDKNKEKDAKQTFVTLKPTTSRSAKQETSSSNEETKLTDLKMKLKRTGKLDKEREDTDKYNTNKESTDEHIDWKIAKSKLKPVMIEENKLEKRTDEDDSHGDAEEEEEAEHLDIREDRIDWTQAKMKLKRVASTDTDANSREVDADVASSANEDQDADENAKMSALSKCNPMDETLLVDMNDTVSDGELEGMVRYNMTQMDDSILQLADAASKDKGKDDMETCSDAQPNEKANKKLEVEEPINSPKKEPRDQDRDFTNDHLSRIAKENIGEAANTKKESQEKIEEKSSVCDRKRVRSDDSETSHSSTEKGETFGAKTAKSLSNRSPLKKKQKLLANDDGDFVGTCLSPGNLFIDPKTPETSQSTKGRDSESDMDMTSPVKSPVKFQSEGVKETKSPIGSPTKLKRGKSQKDEMSDGSGTENNSPPEGVKVTKCLDEEECRIFSSSTPVADESYPLKRPKVDTPLSESKFALGAPKSPSVTHKKLDCSVEEYSDTTTDIIKRWRERRYFLNLKGSPRTVAERMEEEEEKSNTRDQLPLDEDSAHSKVSHFLSSLPAATSNAKEANLDHPENVDKKPSRLSTASKRSSTLSHCSVRSREEMEADLDKGMRELEKRLHMFDDEDDDEGSPICSIIRKGPSHFAAKMNKTAAKVSKPAKEETISESDEEDDSINGAEEKKLQPSTSGSDVLDFIKEKRTRLMRIQDESIRLDSDTDADDSQLQPKLDERASSRHARPGVRSPVMGTRIRQRRRSRSVGRPVVELGAYSPKNTYTEKALSRLGLCTPARNRFEPSSPRLEDAQLQVHALCTPHRSNRFPKSKAVHTSNSGNVYIVDMNCSNISDDYNDRYHTSVIPFNCYSNFY